MVLSSITTSLTLVSVSDAGGLEINIDNCATTLQAIKDPANEWQVKHTNYQWLKKYGMDANDFIASYLPHLYLLSHPTHHYAASRRSS